MSVRIPEENLGCTIGSCSSRQVFDLLIHQVLFPGVDVIDHQGVVVSPVMPDHIQLSATDQVQFLVFSQQVPGAGEIKIRAGNRLQLLDLRIKITTGFDILNM